MYIRACVTYISIHYLQRGCIVAPRPTAYADTIVEISITVSSAINPIPALFAYSRNTTLFRRSRSRDQIGRKQTRDSSTDSTYPARLICEICAARDVVREITIMQQYLDTIRERIVRQRADITMQIRGTAAAPRHSIALLAVD